MTNRRVAMFRAHVDPSIPPKPRNAFMMGDGPNQLPGEAFLTEFGVLVKTKLHGAGEYLIPYSNIQCTQLVKEEVVEELKPRIGRPPKAI